VIETVPSGNMGRRKREGNHSPPKNKAVQDLERNEENGHPDQHSNKTKTKYTKEHNKALKNISERRNPTSNQ
jgi:hypothetical protein